MKSGIVGTGFMSRVHAQAVLAAGGELVGFVASTQDKANEAARHYPGARGFASIDALIDAGADVVHVCTPNHLHEAQAAHAIGRSVAVICEKPLATSVDAALRLTESAAQAGVVAAVPFVYRYYAAVQEIKARLASRSEAEQPWLLHGSYLQDWLAEPTSMNWRVDPKLGGGSRAFGDIGVHWCDLIEFVTGQRIVSLSARLGNAFVRAGDAAANATEDGGVIQFATDAGSIGSLVVSQVSAGRKNRLWFSIDGADRSYSFDQEAPDTFWQGELDENRWVVRDPERQHLTARARASALPSGHPQGYQHCFNDFVASVYAAVAGEPDAAPPRFADGLRAARLTEATLVSARENAWVDVETEYAAVS
ncbi:Gfo/Idh/MocA family protein [Leifsonia sp. NPDC058194]|uniref:Gfo/Idh/MocA family protein n=1 Tax=Leifsonia sp. NPDC058194 TaxID=3346374 RepID=UPI0036D9814C